ncbi:hypothetical protein NA57DRAFT_60886 [Rhizodiscina lignyota]|uniref:SRPBCC domain-containing protein n=1 Tax=Rhizodiscina lignyota TaxID=1504668 RepID=A0A9P4M5X7_9PEZI|nr:hypothetical protein NA57DRAFT_60886 [Rhizodiscina lignyota]
MGQSQSIVTQIEIAASPKTVRAVFLDFQRYKEWHQDWTFESLNPNVQPADLMPEDRLKIDLKGTTIKPVVLSPKKTILVQKEDLNGLLAFLFRPGWGMRKQTVEGFETFNRDLKATIESRAQN